MSDDRKSTLSEISKQTFVAVGPARIAGFTLLTNHLMAQGDDGASSSSDMAKTSMGRLTVAQKMLNEGVHRLLRESGVELPGLIEKKRVAALSAVDRMIEELGATESSDDVRLKIRDPNRFMSETLAKVDELVTDFLAALDSHALDMDTVERQKERDVIKSAVGEIQTISMSINLISINASIEAARAGAAGRGFGVIANEIQTLSMRSQESLQKIMVNVAEG
ncbi:MAG: methyl-accepting chemotaxis protein [Pseudomonadota bacterium]